MQRTGGASLAAKVAGAKNIQDAGDKASLWLQHTCLPLAGEIWWVNGIKSGVFRVLGTMVNELSGLAYSTWDGKFLSDWDKQIDFTAEETH